MTAASNPIRTAGGTSRPRPLRVFRRSSEVGDIVISVRGTMGKVALVAEPLAGANVTANLMRLVPDRERVWPPYLLRYLLSTQFRADCAASPQTTIKTVTSSVLQSL